MQSIVVVGASLAGLSAARALRSAGYSAELTVVGAEPQRPYDRPPLTKDWLRGRSTVDDLALEASADDVAATWILGTSAVALDSRRRRITLADRRTLRADGLVLATGADAAPHPLLPTGANVHTVRTIGDAERLRAALRPGVRVVIVGAGLIGTEVAATAAQLGADVTLLAQDVVPLRRVLGEELGALIAAEHRAHAVRIIAPCLISQVRRDGADGAGAADEGGAGAPVTAIGLADGTTVDADVVVVGVGSRAATGWLAGSGLTIAAGTGGGIACDDAGRTGVDGVLALGDCAAWWDPVRGAHHRVDHWSGAVDRAATVAATLLGRERPAPRAPWFWTDQYDLHVQVAGDPAGHDEFRVETGSVAERSFLAHYLRAGDPVAVAALNQPRLFTRARRALGTAAALAS